MSYYSSKHPGLYLYLILTALTLAAFILLNAGTMLIGALSILWGVFTALRALSLYEISAYYDTYTRQSRRISKEHNGQSSALAHDLMRRMSGSINMKQGLRALYCLHERTILWFAFALIYTAFTLHMSAPLMDRTALMEMVCTLFMIGAIFWGGQSYAYNREDARLIALVFAGALCTSLYALPADLSTARLTQSLSELSISAETPGTPLILLALYSIAILIYALLRQNKTILSVIGGIGLIALLAFCHLSTEPSHATTALWISGWGLFSVFWTRAWLPVQKRYILHQYD